MKIDLVKDFVLNGKYARLIQNNQYTFDVDLRLTKFEIKKLIEEIFNVKVLAVNTHIPPIKKKGRSGSTTRYKRAIVTLKNLEPGMSILPDYD
jgi:large subunit ribosomal protein L23